ncbi:hypothetical protein V2J09_018534 [Rumex salicifolius]
MTSVLPDSSLSRVQPKKNLDAYVEMQYTTTITEVPKQHSLFNIKLWGWSFISMIPWAVNSRGNFETPTTINRGLKRKAQRRHLNASNSMSPPVRFRPYVGKVPWHTGARAVLSQLFPRYGHYCGPNWSSGKDGGSLIWDKRPIDWLDYCCYCHDMGYDTHDQAKLLEADLAFLDCLEKPHITKGNKQVAHVYRTMCIQGLRSFLIPYRRHLLKMQSVQEWFAFGWVNNIRWRGWNILSNLKRE